jgi:hypothetical protein
MRARVADHYPRTTFHTASEIGFSEVQLNGVLGSSPYSTPESLVYLD